MSENRCGNCIAAVHQCDLCQARQEVTRLREQTAEQALKLEHFADIIVERGAKIDEQAAALAETDRTARIVRVLDGWTEEARAGLVVALFNRWPKAFAALWPDTVTHAVASARSDALEEAAKVCETVSPSGSDYAKDALREAAETIRALKTNGGK